MTISISARERDALYDQLLDRLSGVGDIEIAIQAENFETAERLGREYADELRLLVDDLGLGEGGSDAVELTTPPDLLRRVLTRMRLGAEGQLASHESEWAELRVLKERSTLVATACTTVLKELDERSTR